MFKSEYTWIVVTGEITNPSLPSSNMSSGRISFLRQLYPGMIDTDGTCVETWPVASQLSVSKYFNVIYGENLCLVLIFVLF